VNIHFLEFDNDYREYVWLTYVTAMKPHIEKIWGWEDNWQKENYSNSLEIYSTYILVLEEQKLGYIQFKRDKDFIFLSMIVLEEKYQSIGYGPTVIDKIQALNPHLPLKLRCFKVNENAYNFYLKNGFSLVSSDNEFHTLYRDEKDT